MDRVAAANAQAKAGVIGGAMNQSGQLEGGSYTPTSEVSVLSTEQGKGALNTMVTDHTADLTKLNAIQQNKDKTLEYGRQKQIDSVRNQGGITAEEALNSGVDLNDYTYVDTAKMYLPKNSGTISDNPQSRSAKEDQDLIDNTFNDSLHFIDSSADAVIGSIRADYEQRARDLQEVSKREVSDTNTGLLRNGISRYAPGDATRILSNVERRGLRDLSDLGSKELQLISQAEQARASNKLTLFASKRDELVKLRDKKQAKLDELAKTAQEEKKKAQEIKVKASRDSAISGLLTQGITDPKQILEYLNFYDDGTSTGGDFTAKEVQDTLKALAPEDKLDKLSGATRDFYILKGQGQLPSSISGLPEDQQMFAYLRQQKAASTIGSAGSKDKITLTEAKNLGLPISTVGMSQADIVDSLQGKAPPAWFVEKLQNETQQSIMPDSPVLKDAWETYRTEAISKAEGTDKKSASYTKARDYFTATYDGLEEEELDQIAKQVETYVNGGKTYADAVAQTEADLK